MSTLALPSFNPFTFANRLKATGVPEKQAVAEAELLHDVLAQQMATKADIAELRSDIKLLYWMIGVLAAATASIMAGMVSLIIKAYF